MFILNKLRGVLNIIAVIGIISGCNPVNKKTSRISSEPFGKMDNGRDVTLYTLTNKSGANVKIINLGGIIVSLNIPDRNGNMDDIVLGLDSVDEYMTASPYFGAIVGRYANRIKDGKFSINGHDYTLAINNGPNALHGGVIGFDKKIWDVETFEGNDHAGLILSMVSDNGEEGYPGNLSAQVEYTFTDENELSITYRATTDKTTVINLSQHSYFNLDGHASGSIENHEVMINASHYTPVDATLIPTGEIAPVKNTPMDFRTSKPIGRDIEEDFEQIKFGSGFDHNWVIDHVPDQNGLTKAAEVHAAASGRVLKVYTDQPGLQFYTGNFLTKNSPAKGSITYNYRGGFCLETQHFPDSPNQEKFPSTLLYPGDVYESKTVFEFSTF